MRSDIDFFAQRSLALETAYTAFTHSLRDDFHVFALSGYLEEMYAGYGGEILYRPFDSRFALGAEIWHAYRSDPFTALNLGVAAQGETSSSLNLWYDIPRHDITASAKIGRFLGGDRGLTLALDKTFNNGASLSGFISISDREDQDLFGGTTHSYSGLRLSLPLGVYGLPAGSAAKIRAQPLGRDSGQTLDNPLPLYELTRGFGYDHMAQHWDRVVP